jgi:ribonuclease HI
MIHCYTDGSCFNNGKSNAKAGYAVLFPDNPKFNASDILPDDEPHTNNRAEYYAVLAAICIADDIDPTKLESLCIHTDCMLIINSMTKWIKGWKKNGWKTASGSPVANKDLLDEIDEKMNKRKVEFAHVLSHTGKKDYDSVQNAIVDKMAKCIL